MDQTCRPRTTRMTRAHPLARAVCRRTLIPILPAISGSNGAADLTTNLKSKRRGAGAARRAACSCSGVPPITHPAGQKLAGSFGRAASTQVGGCLTSACLLQEPLPILALLPGISEAASRTAKQRARVNGTAWTRAEIARLVEAFGKRRRHRRYCRGVISYGRGSDGESEAAEAVAATNAASYTDC